MLVEFSLTFIFHHVWEKPFNLWCSYSYKMHWIYAFFLMPQSAKSVSPRRKGWRKLGFTLSNFSQKIWLETSGYLCFVCFKMFLNVMTLQFCKWYLSNSVVLNLSPLLWNYGNLTLKLHQKNSYLNEGLLFVGRFKVGRFPRMINKKVVPQFFSKPFNQLKNCLP